MNILLPLLLSSAVLAAPDCSVAIVEYNGEFVEQLLPREHAAMRAEIEAGLKEKGYVIEESQSWSALQQVAHTVAASYNTATDNRGMSFYWMELSFARGRDKVITVRERNNFFTQVTGVGARDARKLMADTSGKFAELLPACE